MLTKREIEIIKLIELGLTSKEISKKLNISEQTVKTHKENIYLKLDAHNKIQAIIKYSNIENK